MRQQTSMNRNGKLATNAINCGGTMQPGTINHDEVTQAIGQKSQNFIEAISELFSKGNRFIVIEADDNASSGGPSVAGLDQLVNAISLSLVQLKNAGLTHIAIRGQESAQALLDGYIVGSDSEPLLNAIDCADRLKPFVLMAKMRGFDVRIISPDKDGEFVLDEFNERSARDSAKLLGVNEGSKVLVIGALQDVSTSIPKLAGDQELHTLASRLKTAAPEQVAGIRFVHIGDPKDLLARTLQRVEDPTTLKLEPGEFYIAPNEYPLSATSVSNPLLLGADKLVFRVPQREKE